MKRLKQIAERDPSLAATLAKLLPESRLYAYKLRLDSQGMRRTRDCLRIGHE